ncbi:hypothetical protein GSF08_06465 [Clostridiaceae bacterium DONG20-135]|uniref:Uncharacterized protein n=1 Tax=Copranaerobaculum intestinale TaxID=2692629 RepID=A0A6N8U7R3_9FIRM|nr:MFS transporter [Copranaerobaculum intestinale]MXQ73575.1 hypothetical protein [Copranaerobaculum intestinale]
MPVSHMLKKTRIISWSCFIIGFMLIMAQAFYYLFLQVKGYEYVWDVLPYLINTMIILLLVGGIYLLRNTKRYHLYTLAAGGIILLLNFGYMLQYGGLRSCVVSFGSFDKPMVVKIDQDTKQAAVYQKTWFIFAASPQPLNTPVTNYTIHWLTDDIAAFTYESNGSKHVYVMANGERGRNSYYHPAAELQGSWKSGKQKIEIEPLQLTDQKAVYDLSNATEVGTTAVVLNNAQGEPMMVIGYGKDLTFTKQGSIKKGSSIVMLDLTTLKKTIYQKTSTDYSENFKTPTPAEKGKSLVSDMKSIIRNDPDLSAFKDEYNMYKIDTASHDLGDIALLVSKAMNHQGGEGTSCSVDVTLHSVTKSAGDDTDFFMEVATTETASCGVESETLDITWYYRVMKTKNGYLAAKTLHSDKGDYGLKALKNPQPLILNGDAYHYFIQK